MYDASLSIVDRSTKQENLMPRLAVTLALSLALAGGVQAAEGNVEDGKEVFKKCTQCHEVGPGAKNKLGPILNGILGRKAGTVPEFNYSPANKKAGEDGWLWDEANLLKYLTNPREAMPGNRMAFAGLSDEQDRIDVVAYLKTFK
jgi:cytochrome c